MIRCGWCNHPTPAEARCVHCGHVEPARPWTQRGEAPPTVQPEAGRPPLDADDIRRRYAEAREDLERSGRPVTVEAIAEALDRSPRTVREWRKRYALR